MSSGWYTVDWASGPGLCHQVRNARRQIERPSSCWSARGRAWCISHAACAPAGPVAPPRRNPQRAARRAASGPAPRRRPLPLASRGGCLVCRVKSLASIRYLWPGQAEAPVGVNSSWFLAEAVCTAARGLENSLLRALSHRPELESGRTQGNLACLLQSKRLIINATQGRNPNRGFQPASPPKYHSPGGPGPARVEKMDKEAPAIAE